ncbi:unnamed protein product, partial [Sphagnum jensenii]
DEIQQNNSSFESNSRQLTDDNKKNSETSAMDCDDLISCEISRISHSVTNDMSHTTEVSPIIPFESSKCSLKHVRRKHHRKHHSRHKEERIETNPEFLLTMENLNKSFKLLKIAKRITPNSNDSKSRHLLPTVFQVANFLKNLKAKKHHLESCLNSSNDCNDSTKSTINKKTNKKKVNNSTNQTEQTVKAKSETTDSTNGITNGNSKLDTLRKQSQSKSAKSQIANTSNTKLKKGSNSCSAASQVVLSSDHKRCVSSRSGASMSLWPITGNTLRSDRMNDSKTTVTPIICESLKAQNSIDETIEQCIKKYSLNDNYFNNKINISKECNKRRKSDESFANKLSNDKNAKLNDFNSIESNDCLSVSATSDSNIAKSDDIMKNKSKSSSNRRQNGLNKCSNVGKQQQSSANNKTKSDNQISTDNSKSVDSNRSSDTKSSNLSSVSKRKNSDTNPCHLDLSGIQSQIKCGFYKSVESFESDFTKIFDSIANSENIENTSNANDQYLLQLKNEFQKIMNEKKPFIEDILSSGDYNSNTSEQILTDRESPPIISNKLTSNLESSEPIESKEIIPKISESNVASDSTT